MRKSFFQLFALCVFCMAACLTVGLPLVSCGNKNAKALDAGRLDGNVYHNSYFGFHVNVPQGWYILDRGELDRANRESAQSIPNEAMRREMDRLMELQSVPLLTAYQAEPGSTDGFIPSVQVIAENLKWLPEVKTGQHYLLQAIEAFRTSGIPYEDLDVPITAVPIGGRDCAAVKLRIKYGDYDVVQEWYSIVADGFALNFGFTYDGADAERTKEMEAVRESVAFSVAGK